MSDRELLYLMAAWLLIGFSIGCALCAIALAVFA